MCLTRSYNLSINHSNIPIKMLKLSPLMFSRLICVIFLETSIIKFGILQYRFDILRYQCIRLFQTTCQITWDTDILVGLFRQFWYPHRICCTDSYKSTVSSNAMVAAEHMSLRRMIGFHGMIDNEEIYIHQTYLFDIWWAPHFISWQKRT